MSSSPASASSQRALLQYAHVTLNTTFLSTPVTATLNENLLQREVFDYDFSRERVFLEIAAAEMEAKAAAVAAAARPASSSSAGVDDSDDELAKKSAALSLDGSYTSNATVSAGGDDAGDEDDDVAAAIRASLREY